MRKLITAAGAAFTLTLTACGGGGSSEENSANAMAEDANMMAVDNLMIDQNGMMNGTTDGNVALDPATQNMVSQDMNTNDADTNLANGM